MIKASGPKRGGRQDGAVASMFPIQQTVEAGWTVEAGKTHPVNGPAAGYERTRPAVANEGVVVDGGIGRQGEASRITKSPRRIYAGLRFDGKPVIFPPSPTAVQLHNGEPTGSEFHGGSGSEMTDDRITIDHVCAVLA